MSAIPAPVQLALNAQTAAVYQKIDIAVMGKQLDAQRQTGDAINQMLETTVQAQKQIAQGYLDVQV
ncbi:putative motility protein [Rubripirellula amarantea]|uniref:Motility protein n=1 Tax=Rubripirellula amarantea TaxID=2527999 RepID=A0A5C5WQZ0_9BACT|nr:putative motility protein [Rubripirellula amarantea]MDA8745008.1 putative motility protein [Rubripirellula amarantea]TWT52880.1 hypothetical protein Pla22_05080 [Rubripirellula amarantea]